MTFSFFLYNALISCAAPVIIPIMWLNQQARGVQQRQLQQRLGYLPAALSRAKKRPARIWLHAASVGEVGVAVVIIDALRQLQWPGEVVLSTTTEQGLARAVSSIGSDVPCFFAPLDWSIPVKRALDTVQPDVLAILETEIWPNLIIYSHRRGVRTAIINGRISQRTIDSYLKVRPIICQTLSHVDLFSMIAEDDAERLRWLGAPRERLAVRGNAKFDAAGPTIGDDQKEWAENLYGVGESGPPVIIAGSTRDPEERMIIDAFLRIHRFDPRALLIIAPRHIQRCDQVEKWVIDRGLPCQRRSRIGADRDRRSAPVVLLDTIGELFATYSVASVVFCGGSLVPKGGQNILEPAMWGKPIMFGPSMEDFAQARDLIAKAGGGIQVDNVDRMVEVALGWLREPESARIAGLAARNAIMPHRGAAGKHAQALIDLIG